MPKKIEIEFPADFESNSVSALPIGRLNIGRHVARLIFTPQGDMKMVVPKAAATDGSIIFYEPYAEDELFGFAKAPSAQR